MKSWQNVVALTFAGVLISGSAFAQATTPSGDQKVPDKSEQPKSTTDSEKSGAMKSDKSDMKSDMMKSDQRSARGGNREQVRAAQQALKDKGHDPGSVDGVIGIDVPGLARVLRVVGPIAVPGISEPVSADNAARVLLPGIFRRMTARARLPVLPDLER